MTNEQSSNFLGCRDSQGKMTLKDILLLTDPPNMREVLRVNFFPQHDVGIIRS